LNRGKFRSHAEQDWMLFWHIQSALWGRFPGSVETLLTQDFDTAQRSGIDGLIESLSRCARRQPYPSRRTTSRVRHWSRFYPLLYMLTRVTWRPRPLQ
jgi:hypothetical protein